MEWVISIIAVVILGLAAVAATGRLGEFPATVTDTPQPHVPDGVLGGADLRGLRFAVVPRGYSMQQVDELLDRLAGQLDDSPDRPGEQPVDRSAGELDEAAGQAAPEQRADDSAGQPDESRARPDMGEPVDEIAARPGVGGPVDEPVSQPGVE
jgi:DivIVA domain-containing protein